MIALRSSPRPLAAPYPGRLPGSGPAEGAADPPPAYPSGAFLFHFWWLARWSPTGSTALSGGAVLPAIPPPRGCVRVVSQFETNTLFVALRAVPSICLAASRNDMARIPTHNRSGSGRRRRLPSGNPAQALPLQTFHPSRQGMATWLGRCRKSQGARRCQRDLVPEATADVGRQCRPHSAPSCPAAPNQTLGVPG